MRPQFGLVMPHFGRAANPDLVLDAAARLERCDLDSIWFRDSLGFEPHGYEPPGNTFLDPFTFLAAIARETNRILLGTATLIPIRHPLVVSQLLGGVEALSGGGRLQVGVGAGGLRAPFDAVGIPFETRFDVIDEWIQVLRSSWTTVPTTWEGVNYRFENVEINPRPSPNTLIWYGGSSQGSVVRAVRLADGWLPGRCPLSRLTKLLSFLDEEGNRRGRTVAAGLMPLLVLEAPGTDGELRDSAVQNALELASSNQRWQGPFETVGDLNGLLVSGSPEACLDQIGDLVSQGLSQIIFDLRLAASEIESQLDLFCDSLMPMILKEFRNDG